MRKTPVGVDIAKHKFDVAVLLENQKYKTKKFANTPSGGREFAAWLSRFGDCHICAKWRLNRSQFGIRIDHDLACISDRDLASQSITVWHPADHSGN